MRFPLLVIFGLLWTNSHGLKILGIFPHLGKSHFDFFQPLMKALAEKGHEITVISPFPLKEPILNYTTIDISLPPEKFSFNSIDMSDYKNSRIQNYLTPILLAQFATKICDYQLSRSVIQNFLKSNLKFDLILTEMFNTHCFFGIVGKLKVPAIGLSSSTLMPFFDVPMNYPSNPAYIPNNFMPFSDRMNFLERVENTICYIYHHILYNVIVDMYDNWAVKKHISEDLPPVLDITGNISLTLLNSHFTFTLPRPVTPNFIEVSGLHIGKLKPLPQNIEKWINESTHGVIYFSLGSMIKGHTFPEEKRQMFLKAFGRLPQRVLWKWETETMPEKPDNVMLQKWMPQFDILCHPNVKAFIAHGGLLGATEAVHCGVPMIVMPQFGDQFTNAKAIEASGGGVILDFRSLDEESIYNALKTVLEPDFNKKAKELSARFRDRPLPPLETAIYWVEYVARHGGAPHLRTAAVGMPLYKYLLLDVIAFLAAIVFAISFIFYLITRAIFRKIFATKPKVKVN